MTGRRHLWGSLFQGNEPAGIQTLGALTGWPPHSFGAELAPLFVPHSSSQVGFSEGTLTVIAVMGPMGFRVTF